MEYITENKDELIKKVSEVSDLLTVSGAPLNSLAPLLSHRPFRYAAVVTVSGVLRVALYGYLREGLVTLSNSDFVEKCRELAPKKTRPKRCPSCGGRVAVRTSAPAGTVTLSCGCRCGLSGPHAKTPDEAIENWNQIKVEKKGAPVTRKEQKISPCPHCGSVDCVWPL